MVKAAQYAATSLHANLGTYDFGMALKDPTASIIEAARVALLTFVAGAASAATAVQLTMNPILGCIFVGVGVLTTAKGIVNSRSRNEDHKRDSRFIQALIKQQGGWKCGLEELLIQEGVDLQRLAEDARHNPLAQFYLLMTASHEELRAFLSENKKVLSRIQQTLLENSAAIQEESSECKELMQNLQAEFNMVQHKLDEQGQVLSEVNEHAALLPHIAVVIASIAESLEENVAQPTAMNALESSREHATIEQQLRKGFSAIVDAMQQGVVGTEGDPSLKVDHTPIIDPSLYEPPPLVLVHSERVQTINAILTQCNDGTWLAVCGEAGSGKTQLVGLLARAMCRKILWVRLRGKSASEASREIQTALRSSVPAGDHGTLKSLVKSVLSPKGPKRLIVLDDLPAFGSESTLALLLRLLSEAAAESNAVIVSTTTQRIRTAFIDLLPNPPKQIDCPPLDASEVSELLSLFGAPSEILTNANIRFLTAISSGNPVLVVAAARFLKDRGWQFSVSDVEALLGGEHALPIRSETLERFVMTVSDSGTRELLYRLRLYECSFSTGDVDAIASVAAPIARSIERLHALLGLWVQRESDDRFSLSPLLVALPETNVPESTRVAIHLAIGKRMLSTGSVSLWELSSAIAHFVKARHIAYAGILLIRGLQELLKTDRLEEGVILLSLWVDMPLPSEMPITQQVFLRVQQIAARSAAELPIESLIADLVKLEGRLEDGETWGLIGIAGAAARPIAQVNLPFLLHSFGRMLSQWSTWKAPDGSALPALEGMKPAAILWTTIEYITTRAQLAEWLSTVKLLDQSLRDGLFERPLALDLCITLADRLWRVEHAKPIADRDWQSVHEGLMDLADAASVLQQPYLRACAFRTRAGILSDYENDLDGALTLIDEELTSISDGASRFILHEFAGRQYVSKGRMNEARQQYEAALPLVHHGSLLQQAVCLLNASRAFGDIDCIAAVNYAGRALTTIAEATDLAPIFRAQVWGELAIARWLANDRLGAFNALEDVAQTLLAISDRDDSWKGFFVFFGHACAHYARAASDDGHSSWFDENLPASHAPYRGFFVRGHDVAVSLYDKNQSIGVFSQLALLADALGNDTGVDRWAQRGHQAAQSAQLPALAGTYADFCLVSKVAAIDFDASVPLAFEVARAAAATESLRKQGRSPLTETFDLESAFGELTLPARETAEKHAVMLATVPATLALARRKAVEHLSVADDAARLCENITSRLYEGGSKTYAEKIVNLLRDVFITPKSEVQIIEAGVQSKEWLNEVIAFAGCIVDPEIALERAYTAQVIALSSLDPVMRASMGLERRLALPLVEEYWAFCFTKQRFRFSSPSLISSELAACSSLPPGPRIKRILQVVGRGLEIQPPECARKWLSVK